MVIITLIMNLLFLILFNFLMFKFDALSNAEIALWVISNCMYVKIIGLELMSFKK